MDCCAKKEEKIPQYELGFTQHGEYLPVPEGEFGFNPQRIKDSRIS